jgi:hypothetical protein
MDLQPYVPSPDQWKGYFSTTRRPFTRGRMNRAGPNYYIHYQRGGSKPTVISPTTQIEAQAQSDLEKLTTGRHSDKSIKHAQSRKRFISPGNSHTVKISKKPAKKTAKKPTKKTPKKKTTKQTVKKSAKKTPKKSAKKTVKKRAKDLLGD